MAQEEKAVELITVSHSLRITHRVRPGPYATIYFDGLKEGKVWAVRCPSCKGLKTPPTVACKVCHRALPEFPQGWEALSGKGYLEAWYDVVETSRSPETGELQTSPYMAANFWLDEGIQFQHAVGVAPGSEEAKKLKRGMRVQIVWYPPEERTGRISDIKYFKVLWDEPIRKLGPAIAPNDLPVGKTIWDLPPLD